MLTSSYDVKTRKILHCGGVFMNELKQKIKDLLEEIKDQKKLEELYQYAKMLLRSK